MQRPIQGERPGNDNENGTPLAGRVGLAAAVLGLFSATAFISAFLLFALEPMFAKMVLPVLGGSASVWAVALTFFQMALLAGYAWAHLLIARLPLAWTGYAQLALAAAALLVLPLGLPAGWEAPPSGEPYIWQLGLFAVAIGLPFLAIAANAPLLQAWFSASGHAQARDPYFLYAASNLGSLAALIGYPFVLEPALGLSALSRTWSVFYLVLLAALAVCFAIVMRFGAPAGQAAAAPEAEPGSPPSWPDRLWWCWLALVPAALLTAFTTHITTDVASAPLLWVIPLALYLATFVLAFAERIVIPMRLLLFAQLIAVVLALLELSQTKWDKWVLTSATGVAAFFLSALVAHRTLYLSRPAPRYLTGFYLWLSLGGALGGIFAALVAPRLFSEVLEYPILIALTVACRPGMLGAGVTKRAELLWMGGIAAAGFVLILYGGAWSAELGLTFGQWGFTPALTLLFALGAAAFYAHAPRQLVAVLLMCGAVTLLPSAVKRGLAQRSYYGVYRVSQSEDGQFNVMTHGTTLHGAQRIRGADGHVVSDTTPGTYYYPGSPLQSSVRIAQSHIDAAGGGGRIGIVGLGTGSLGCYARKGERWSFFEIDPLVARIAEKSNYFTFLANCLPDPDIVIGDARLSLAKEPDNSFDLIIVDAFTSDAVPVHLMTAEALRLYARKIKDGGFAVLHISNRYLDLDAVLGATMRLVPELKGLIVSDDTADGSYAQNASSIAVFAKDTRTLDDFRALPGFADFRNAGVAPWSDDSSDILGPFLSQWRQTH